MAGVVMVGGWAVSSVSSLPASSLTVLSLTAGGSGSEPLSQAPRLKRTTVAKSAVRVRPGYVILVVSFESWFNEHLIMPSGIGLTLGINHVSAWFSNYQALSASKTSA